MKALTIVILFFLACNSGFCQKQGQELMDSLLSEIPKAPNDSIRVRLYKQVADGYFFIDTEKAFQFSRTGLSLAKKISWNRAISIFLMMIGRGYSDKGNIDSCMHYYNKALVLQKKAGDNRNIATTLINMGTAEQNIRSNYPKATEYYFEGLQYAEKEKSPYMIASANNNLSVIYLAQNNNGKALSYATKALGICQKQDGQDPNFLNEWGISLINMANAHLALKNSALAETHFKKAISMYDKSQNQEGIATGYYGMASLPGLDYRSKIEYGTKSKALWEQVNPIHPIAVDNLGNLGISYLNVARYDSLNKVRRGDIVPQSTEALLLIAEKYLRKAVELSHQKGDLNRRSYYTGVLSELQALRGDYKNAYFNFREFQTVQDSIFSQERKNEIAEQEGKREIALRDKQIELNELALESQKKQRLGLIFGVILLSVIGGLLLWQNRTRKRTNTTLLHLNAELDEANKIKARFFAILSHDLRSPVSNLINFLHLQKEEPDLLSPQIAEMHQKRISESAESLLENMESMLLWSKGQMQNFRPQTKTIEVETLFSYIRKFFSGVSDVQFSFDNPQSLTVTTDEDYLKTIMQNLTGNAVKALKKTPDARIRWEARLENGQIILSITDNGPGASAEQLNALYSSNEITGGKTGFGMHLIRDLANAISCSVTFKSRPNEGIEFQLTFAQ